MVAQGARHSTDPRAAEIQERKDLPRSARDARRPRNGIVRLSGRHEQARTIQRHGGKRGGLGAKGADTEKGGVFGVTSHAQFMQTSAMTDTLFA